MQINPLGPYMASQKSVQRPADKSSCTTHSPFSDFFTREEAWSSGPEGYSITASPYIRLSDSWERWKAQTSSQDSLPDSKGLTEENIAYLKEHYSGELGWEERMDVLNTMQSMDILTGNQVLQACGGGMAAISIGAMRSQTVTVQPLQQSNPWETSWDVLFKDTPIAGFHTLDDVLSWVDTAQKKAPDEAELAFRHLLDLRG